MYWGRYADVLRYSRCAGIGVLGQVCWDRCAGVGVLICWGTVGVLG